MLFLCSLSGCGYTLQHRLKEVFDTKRGVFVPVFTNNTDETGAERVFTNALIRELESHGEMTLTDRKSGGLELRGTITSITYRPTALTDLGLKGLQPGVQRLPVELLVSVGLSIHLVDPDTGKVLWGSSFTGFRRAETPLDRTYDFEAPSAVGLYTQSLVESKYNDIARDISRSVYDEMVQLF